MGLFLGPFSGHAVGGGGGTGGPGASTPPPGTGGEAGQRSEVDTVNRSPLRLLRTTMNKHKPKFMKVVPPGQQVGTIAPPYAWDARERDDWQYKLNKPKAMWEGEFDNPAAGGPPTPSPQTTPQPKDPRHARVDAIHAELQQLHAEVRQLMARRRQLTQAGKAELQQRPKYTPKPSHELAIGPRPGSGKYITLDEPVGTLKSEAQETPPLGLRSSGRFDRRTLRRGAADEELLKRHRETEAKREHAKPPQQSAEIIGITNQLKQKHARIDQLTQELQQLRQQLKQTHESTRLSSNNLHRLSLLLK